MPEENNPNYDGLVQAIDTSVAGFNAATTAAYNHYGAEAAKNIQGLIGTYKFLDGNFLRFALPGASVVAAYNTADPDLQARATINAGLTEFVSWGNDFAVNKTGIGKVASILTGASVDLYLNQGNLDFYGWGTQQLSLFGAATADYYYVKEYQKGTTTFYEAYDSGNQELHFGTEGYETTDYTTIKLNLDGLVSKVTRTDNGNKLEINLRANEWKITNSSGVSQSGSLLNDGNDNMTVENAALVTQMLNSFKVELQLRDPNINLEPLNTAVNNITIHENVTKVSNAEKQSVSWGNSYLYNNVSEKISLYSRNDISIIKDNVMGNVFVQMKDPATGYINMVSHDNITGLNFLYYADPANGGARSIIPVSSISVLNSAQKAAYIAIITAGNQAYLDGGKELISLSPSLKGNIASIFGSDQLTESLEQIVETAISHLKDSDGNRDVSNSGSLQNLPSGGNSSYQNIFKQSDPFQLSDETRASIIKNGPDSASDARISQFWTLHNKAMTEGVVSSGPNGSTIRTLSSGISLQTLSVSGNKHVSILKSGSDVLGVHTAYTGNYQQEVTEILNADNDTNSNLVKITTTDVVNGKAADTPTMTIKYPENFIFSDIGGFVGNLIGEQLADGNVFKSIAYTSVLKTLGQHGGSIIDFLNHDNELVDAVQRSIKGTQLSDLTDLQSRPDIFDGFMKNFTTAVIGKLAGALVQEVGEEIEIDGIAGEVFNVVANEVTVGILTEGYDVLFREMGGGLYSNLVSSGFNFDKVISYTSEGNPITIGDQIQIQLLNAVAGFAGQRLAGEIIEAESEAAAIFGSIGSTLGSSIGLSLAAGQSLSIAISTVFSSSAATANAALAGAPAGPIGIAIGAFLGAILGTSLGNLFGGEDHPSSFTYLDFNPTTKLYQMGGTFVNDEGPAQLSMDMTQAVIDGVNDILTATGGTIRHTSIAPEMDIGWREGVYFVNVRDGDNYEFASAGDAISFAALHTLKNFDLVGGHAIVMRAWHNSEAADIQEWKADIEVAEAFQVYMTNPTGVLAMMMDQPNSTLAQSWAAVLKKAGELGLHLPHGNDIDGGWNELLLARGDIDPAWIPTIEGDSIVLTDPVTGQKTTLNHVIGPGYEIVRIEGTDGNDIIEVRVDGPSIAYVDAGSGDDTVEGSDQRDIILGGSGNDAINGNAGDDWINGGSGEDTIHGNGGLDLIYGGDDNDLLYGDEDGDAVYGGKGNDILEGRLGNDELFGGYGDDALSGNEGTDILYGNEGNDILNSTGGDLLVGGTGNDTYNMTGFGDRIIVSRNEGHDIINGNSSSFNIIEFDKTFSPNELWFQSSGNDLIIKILGENQSILVKNIFASSQHKFVFEVDKQIRIDGADTGIHNSGSYIWIEAHLNAQYSGSGGLWDAPVGSDNNLSNSALVAKKAAYQNFYNQGSIPSFVLNPFYTSNSWENVHPEDAKFFGTSGNDSFTLSPGNTVDGDRIYGAEGNDTITAPLSYSYDTHDYVYGDSGDDNINGAFGNDRLIGGLGNDIISGDKGNDLVYAGSGNDTVYGGDSQDDIFGGLGNDYLYGQQGHDKIYGGDGNDYIEDYHGRNVLYGEGGDDTITITGVSDNYIDGGDGNDNVTSHDGNDRLAGGNGIDTLRGAGGDDWINGDDGNDTIYGGSGNDLIDGGAGDDLIYSDAGNDSIEGSSGFDTVTYAASTAAINLSLATRTGTGGDAQGDVLTGIESVIGTAFNDTIEGNTADNTLNAGAGTDTLSYAAIGSGVVVNLALVSAQNTIGAGVDTVSGFENLTGSAFADTLIGDTNANILIGGDGDDIMEGGAGNDTISGGAGDDTARYSSATSAVTVSLALTSAQNTGGAGTDTLSAMQNLIGSAYNDVLTGDSTGNIIEGGAGNDTLNGGSGTDTVSFASASAGVTVNLTTISAQNTGGAGTDTITAFESIVGSNFNDTLTGDLNNNIIEGGNGNDVMDGGSATDTVSYSSASTGVTVTLALTTAQNTIGAGTDTLLNFERINGSAFNDTLTGNGSNNQIDGGDGNDLLDGGLGSDTVSYQSAKKAVTVSLSVAEGQNTLGAGIDTLISFESLTGSNYNDTLIGNSAGNTLKGGNGDDVLDGAAGNDTITGEAGIDTASYQSATSAVTVNLSITAAQNTGGGGSDTITTTENLTGSNFDDILIGDATANILKGGLGNDTLDGGLGDDTLNGESGSDTATYAAAASAVTVNLATLTAQNTVAMGNDILVGIENLIGSAFNDTLTGDNFANIIEGGAGNDNINGGLGTDTVSYLSSGVGVTVNLATTTSQNTVGAGSDTITNIENILGSGLNDTLTGDANANVIEGGNGNDVLNGAGGIDTVSYLRSAAAVTVNISTTASQNTVGAGSDTLTNFENITGSAFNDTLTGNSGDNIIDGGAGNDSIDGGSGNDTLIGGTGVDTLSYAAALSIVTINLGLTTAQSTGGGGTDTVSGFENLIGTTYSDTLTGNNSNNAIDGGNGNDVIDGGAGDDILIGAAGTDTLTYAAATSGISISLALTAAQITGGSGTDTISGFERLTGSAFADILVGDAADNILSGGDGDDILEGGAGNDTLNGSNGIDTARYNTAASAVTVSLALTSAQNTVGAGTDTLSSIQILIGSNFNDTLTGSNNDDTIEGGLGNDALNGGSGNDTASYAGSSAAVTVNLATTAAQNTVGAGTDTITAFENIRGSDFNDALTGDANSNVIEGGLGNDTLDGAGGTDTVSYKLSNASVTVNLSTTSAQNTIGAGTDTILNFERIIGSSYNDVLTGNSSTNQIEGGAGNDIMDGGAGTDTLAYQTALSGVTVNLALTVAQNTGGAGVDTISNFESITGSGFDDILYGNSGTNTLKGGNGNDILSGAAGTDSLYGEAGADIFLFEAATAFSGIDTVYDFSTAQADKLNISSLLLGYNPLQSAIDDFVTFTTTGANTTFAVDRDGTASTYTSQTIATLNAVTGLDADTLLTNGNLVVI